MTRGQSAILAGATGLVGGHCLEALLDDDRFASVLVIGRRSCGRQHPRLEEIVTPLAELGSQELPPADVCISALGTTMKAAGSRETFRRVDLDHVANLAKAAAIAGVGRFVLVSAIGADPQSAIFYNRVKGLAEKAVLELGFHCVHILQPSLLLGRRREQRTGEAMAQALSPWISWMARGPWAGYRPVQALDLAREIVRLAEDDAAGHFRHRLSKGSEFVEIPIAPC